MSIHFKCLKARSTRLRISGEMGQVQHLRFVSFYAPNRNPERNRFFVSLPDIIDLSVPTFLCGDFNTVLDPVFDVVIRRHITVILPIRVLRVFRQSNLCCRTLRPIPCGARDIQVLALFPGIMGRGNCLPVSTISGRPSECRVRSWRVSIILYRSLLPVCLLYPGLD